MDEDDNAEVKTNPKSLGYGIQQIKLDYWNPENEKYWEVNSFIHFPLNIVSSKSMGFITPTSRNDSQHAKSISSQSKNICLCVYEWGI